MSSQQLLLGTGVPIEHAKYIDEVFSTYLHTGTGSAITINNGIDLSGKGGLVWLKGRSSGKDSKLSDTVRGVNSQLGSEFSTAASTNTNVITSFNDNGFTMGTNVEINQSGVTHASWSFRQAKGFFDVVTWTGDNSGERDISHSLGSNIGMIIAKRTDSAANWHVWHRDLPHLYSLLELDNTQAVNNGSDAWGYPSQDGGPVINSSSFSVDNRLNDNNATYVAYVFAGGESPDSNSTAVTFSSSNDNRLTIPDNDDFDFGTGDFTIECWVNPANVTWGIGTVFCIGDKSSNNSVRVEVTSNESVYFYCDNSTNGNWSTARLAFFNKPTAPKGQWRHIAVTKSSNVIRLFVDGKQSHAVSSSINTTYTQTNSVGSGSNGSLVIGSRLDNDHYESDFDGSISNFRIVKGTAVYTSSFTPPNKPLTNITNTKLLCCNTSSVTGSTVTPATISSNGSMTATINGPFDDPAAFIFGDAEDQPVIKAGSYIGNGEQWWNKQIHVTLGFEPQWLLIKNSDQAKDWKLYDSMRGIPWFGSGSKDLIPNENDMETSYNPTDIMLTATGFYVATNQMELNGDGDKMIYLAIRRPDALVSKPRTATELLSMVTGVASSTIPPFASGFPVDIGIYRKPASYEDWSLNSRTMGKYALSTVNSLSQNESEPAQWDNNTRFGPLDATKYNSDYQSWAWRRNAGFTTVNYEGDGKGGRQIAHDMNNTIEMMWIKNRTENNTDWMCYHKGLNGGTNPSHHYVNLNNKNIQVNEDRIFYDTEPTSTHFTVGDHEDVNKDGETYIAMLFSSVSGMSKCGYYNGSNNTITITTGFQPRFLIIRRITGSQNANWHVFDTLRGLGTTSNNSLYLNDNDNHSNMGNIISLLSNGYTLSNNNQWNGDGEKYIYYAHA